jgi:hypothetical protein
VTNLFKFPTYIFVHKWRITPWAFPINHRIYNVLLQVNVITNYFNFFAWDIFFKSICFNDSEIAWLFQAECNAFRTVLHLLWYGKMETYTTVTFFSLSANMLKWFAVLACACDLSRVFLGRSYGMDKRIHLNSAITLRDSQNPQPLKPL